MKKKTKFTLISLLILTVCLILFIYLFTMGGTSQQILSGNYHTESSLISDETDGTVYSYSYIIEQDVPPISCDDGRLVRNIDFGGDVHPQTYSTLPCYVEGLRANVDFNAFDVVLTPLYAQRSAPCNPPEGPVYEARFIDTGTTCKVQAGTVYGACQRAEVSCHFKGELRAYDSEGNNVPAVFSMINYLSAGVKIYKEGYQTESCSDEIKNQDETGIDCGGVCEDCESPEPPEPSNYLFIIIGVALVLIAGGIITFLLVRKLR